MNNWDQFQSTPKLLPQNFNDFLLPPTVFEKTNINNTESSFNNSNNNNNNSNINSKNMIANNSTENESFTRGEKTQFTEFSSELEKLKLEIKKLHNENEILRHKNRGKFNDLFLDYLKGIFFLVILLAIYVISENI